MCKKCTLRTILRSTSAYIRASLGFGTNALALKTVIAAELAWHTDLGGRYTHGYLICKMHLHLPTVPQMMTIKRCSCIGLALMKP